MERKDLTPEHIEMMNSAARVLVSMPNKMAVATMAMSLTVMHQQKDNTGVTGNLIGLIHGISKSLCKEHRVLFLQEIKTALEVDVIPMAEDDIKREVSEPTSD